ncbi:MAG: hypothetical protein ACRDKI_06940 [Solirubrobacterales bacterium]
MRLTDNQIVAPDLPKDATWINFEPESIDDLLRVGPVLIEFWDFARVNSLRTLPYMEEWSRRYAHAGATILGVLSPGFTFGRDEAVARAAVKRLGVQHPVLLDPEFALWQEFGNRGWPARYLFGRNGYLKYFHYGEGDYEECELTLQEILRELDPEVDLPPVMDPVRAEDAPGVELPAQTADLATPADNDRLKVKGDWQQGEDWIEAEKAGSKISTKCSAGAAFAVLSGSAVEYPGVHELPIEGGKVSVVAEAPGLRFHGFQFTPETAGV